jgi:polar amino acid transport system substrate-binding protein
MKKFKAALSVAAVTGTLLTAACSNGPAAETTAPAENASSVVAPKAPIETTKDEAVAALLPKSIRDKGEIKAAGNIPYPPYTMYDTDSKATGFDYDLSQALGQKLGIPVSFNQQAFSTIIPSLLSKKYDVILSAMNDTTERQKTLNFVDYTYGGFIIVVKNGNPAGIKTLLDVCGKTVSVQKATVQGDLLRSLEPKCKEKNAAGVQVLELPTDLDAQTALRAGKSQAYVVDAPVAEYVVKTAGDGKSFELVRDPEFPAGYLPVFSGMGNLNTDPEFTEALRAAFHALIADGTYKKILDRYSLTSYAVTTAAINQGK